MSTRPGLFTELKRRKVFRVAVVYAATAFAVLQGADILLPNLGVPDWAMRFLVAVVLLGFPIALVLAWALELRPDGEVKRTEAAAPEPPATVPPLLGKRTLLITALLVAVGIGLSAGWLFKPSGKSASEDQTVAADAHLTPSLAVLPFVNMSGNEDNEYFSDGLTETLLHKLAQVSGLKVAARTSSFAFKGRNIDVREIADALNVAHVLEGSVQRAGDRVRITAQLIQADDGYHLWSDVFDRNLDDIFAVQDDIAVQVATALRGSLLDESAVANDGGTKNTEAYDWYLRGRDALYDRNAERLDDAVNAMRRAIALDPEFALAWAGLSEALAEQARFTGRTFEVREAGEVRESARTAVRLAPDNFQVRAYLAEVLLEDWDVAGAREQLERAMAIDPDNARALSMMSQLLWYEGRSTEALDYAERAMVVDPLDWSLKVESVNKYMAVGKLDQAQQLARRIVDHDPDYVPGLQSLGNVYWRTGRYVEAFRVYHRLLETNPRTAYVIARIAAGFLALGDTESAKRWLDRAESLSPEETRMDRIDLLRLSGESERAIAMLERLVDDRRAGLPANDPDRTGDSLAAMEIDLAVAQQDWARAYTLAKARWERLAAQKAAYLSSLARRDLALAADRLGQVEERDQLLQAVLADVDRRIELGGDHQYHWLDRAATLALMGDAPAAADALQKAFDRGFRSRLNLLSDPVFAKVVEDPAMQAVLERIADRNRADLERLLEVERELGDFADDEPEGVGEASS
jgi:TolB-like protein/cytochrome c-type biogenesis protein CcmH/NrfG